MSKITLSTIHTPNGQEFGATPTGAGSKAKVKVLCHSSQTGEPPVWGDMPTELPKVCPNMPTIAKATGGAHPFHVFDGTKADLAAWKATRTKRLPSRASEGRLQLDPRTAAEAIDPKLSASAQQAWVTRRAAAAAKATEAK